MIVIAVLFFIPLWWVAVSALRPVGRDLPLPVATQPLELLAEGSRRFDNIVELWQGNFRRAITNSIVVSGVTVIVGLVICSTAAFALAVIEFPLRGLVFMIMVVSFLIPFDAIAVPLFGIMRDMKLQNTYTGLILPGIGNGLAVFLCASSSSASRRSCARPPSSTA